MPSDGYATISDAGFIDGLLWPSEWGASGTLKIISDTPFVAKDGKVFPAGKKTDRLTDNWCILSDIVVTGGVPVVDNFTLPQTDNQITPIGSADEPRYSGFYYDANGVYRGTLFTDCPLSATLGSTLNFQAWMNDVAQQRIPPGDTTPTTSQMNQAIDAIAYAPASTTQLGLVEMTVTPANPALPKAVGDNDPRMTDSRAPTGSASGDLSNTYPSPTVVGIRGREISTDRPINGQPYIYDLDTDTLVPGTPSEAAMTITILRDGFTSADGTPNAGRRPSHTNSPGTAWRDVLGPWIIQDGRLRPASTAYADGTHSKIDAGNSNFTVSVVVTAYYDGSTLTTRSKAALLFNIEDERNYWAVLMDIGAAVTALFEVTNGVSIQRGPSVNATLNSQQQGHLSAMRAGPLITWHLVGQEPQLYTSTTHMTARDVGVAAYKDTGTPGAAPTFSDFVVTPAFVKYASSPVLARVPGTWNSRDMCAPSCPVWDSVNSRYVTLPSGFDGTNWAVGAAYSTDLFAWTEEPSNPVIDPISGDGHFIAGASRPVKVGGTWYMVAYRADPTSNPSASIYNPPFRIIGFSSPNLTNGGTWARLNGGQPIVSLGLPGSIGHGGHHDIDLRRCTNGIWQIVIAARGDDGTSVIAYCEGESLLTMGAVSQWNVMGIYGAGSATDLGQPTFDGDDHEKFSVTFQRAHVAGVKRYLCRADTGDGGVTWKHNDIVLAKGASGAWDDVQVFDYSGVIRVGDKGYALHAGCRVAGGADNLQDDVGVITFDWPAEAPAMPSDPTPGFVTLTDGPTVTLDFSSNQVLNAVVTLGGNRTLAVTNARSGAEFNLYVTQDGTGGRTLALPAGWKVAGGGAGAAALTAAANAVDLIRARLVGTVWRVEKVLNFT